MPFDREQDLPQWFPLGNPEQVHSDLVAVFPFVAVLVFLGRLVIGAADNSSRWQAGKPLLCAPSITSGSQEEIKEGGSREEE